MKKVVSLLFAALMGSGVFAQDDHTSQVSVPDDPVVKQVLTRAEEALTQGDRDRALKLWQEILDRMASKVVQVDRAERRRSGAELVVEGDRFEGVRDGVMRQIVTLEGDGLGQYRKLMEPKAKELLDRGLSTSEEHALREAFTRYFLTPSGRAAALALTDLYLEQGRFDEARIVAQRLRAHLGLVPSESQDLPLVLAREAFALGAAGRGDEVAALAASLPPARAEAPVKIAGRARPLGEWLAEAATLSSAAAAKPDAVRPPLTAFERQQWYRPFGANNNNGDGIFVFLGSTVAPHVEHYPVVPLVRDGVVYSSDGKQVCARNLLTSEDVWPPVQGPVAEFSGRRNRNLYFHVVLDDTLLFAYLEGPPVLAGQRAFANFEPIEDIPSRKIVAIDATTGRVQWSHHAFRARSPEDTEFLAKFNVNQPPLVVGDTLYVAGSVLLGVFHQWLCAFERETGQLKWRTYVGAGQMELNMFGNPIKEAVPGHVTESQGVLYFSTNMGVLVAADAATGAILWESGYEQEGIPGTDNPVTYERHPGWMPSRPAIWKDKVFFAPSDSLFLYAADRHTGVVRAVPVARRDYTTRNAWFLGVHHGLGLVAGTHVTAFDAESLELKWRSAELSRDRGNSSGIQGRPAVRGEDVLFTSMGSASRNVRMSRVDIKTGRVQEMQAAAMVDRAGNVVVDTDAFVVSGANATYVYFDLAEVERRLNKEAEARRDDPEVLLRLGDVTEKRGSLAQALAHYERARTLALAAGGSGRQTARRAALKLYNGWMAAARMAALPIPNGPAKPYERFEKALGYAETPALKVRGLMECLEWCHLQSDEASFERTSKALSSGHPEMMVDLAGRLVELFPDLPAGVRLPAGLLAELASGARLQAAKRPKEAVAHYHAAQTRWPDFGLGSRTAWAYAGEKINGILRTFGPDAYREQEEAARKLLAASTESGDVEGLRTVLRTYPQSSVVEEAYLRLSRQLVQAGNLKDGAAEMQRYFARFGRVSASSLYEFARCLDKQGAVDSALQAFRALESRYPGAEVATGEGRVRVESWVKAQLEREPYRTRSLPEETPSCPSGVQTAWRFGPEAGTDDARIIVPGGRSSDSDPVLAWVDREIVALDPETGRARWRKPSQFTPRQAWVHDGKLLAIVDQDVMAVDLAKGDELWRLRMETEELSQLGASLGKAWLLLRTRGQNMPLVLRALDLETGNPVHETPLNGVWTADLSLSPGYVLVRGRDRDRPAICCDALTGAVMGNSFAFRSDATPFLTADDLVVCVTGAIARNQEPVKVVGRDPVTLKDRWSFDAGRGTYFQAAQTPEHLVFELTTASDQRGPNGATIARRRLIVLDVLRGVSRLSVNLDGSEFTSAGALVTPKRVFAKLRTTRSGSLAAERLRAYDLASGTSPWTTTDFAGANQMLAPFASVEHLLIRRSVTSRSSRSTEGGQLFFVDQKTGAVSDRIDLGPASYAGTEPGLTIRKSRLILAVSSEIRGLGP